MILRITILLVCVLLHYLTPDYFLSDFLRDSDLLLLLILIMSIVIYYFRKNKKSINSISTILAINIGSYFLLTASEDIPDSNPPIMFYRLKIIFGIKSGPSNLLGHLIEGLNYIQIFISLILIIILFFLSFTSKKNTQSV